MHCRYIFVLGYRMLLYQRFDIPDSGDWSTGQPVVAKDCWMGREVRAYRGDLPVAARSRQIAEAHRIHAEQADGDAWNSSAAEVFTARGFLWVITQADPLADPLIERFREARLLPAPRTAGPGPAVIRTETRLCLRCKEELKGAGPLCVSCQETIQKSRRREIALTVVGAFVVLGIVVSVIFWAASALLGAFRDGPALTAQFSTSRPVIAAGDSTNLSWNVTGASIVTIDHGIGAVASNGARTVTPASNMAYTLTATGSGRTITRRVVIDVFPIARRSEPAQQPSEDDAQTPPAVSQTDQSSLQDTPPQAVPQPGIAQPAVNESAPVPQGRPTSGELNCTEPVPPGGQVAFENLPDGFLHFDVQDRANWTLLIKHQPDGSQKLIMISQSSQVQTSCAVHWTLTR